MREALLAIRELKCIEITEQQPQSGNTTIIQYKGKYRKFYLSKLLSFGLKNVTPFIWFEKRDSLHMQTLIPVLNIVLTDGRWGKRFVLHNFLSGRAREVENMQICSYLWLYCYCCSFALVVSDSVQPHRWHPTRVCHPWDSPGKDTGVSCHFLLQCMKVKSESEVAQWCPTLSNPMDCRLLGSSIHVIFQARVLEWVITASSLSLYEWF